MDSFIIWATREAPYQGSSLLFLVSKDFFNERVFNFVHLFFYTSWDDHVYFTLVLLLGILHWLIFLYWTTLNLPGTNSTWSWCRIHLMCFRALFSSILSSLHFWNMVFWGGRGQRILSWYFFLSAIQKYYPIVFCPPLFLTRGQLLIFLRKSFYVRSHFSCCFQNFPSFLQQFNNNVY